MKTYRKHFIAALSALTLGAAALGAHAQTADQAWVSSGRLVVWSRCEASPR